MQRDHIGKRKLGVNEGQSEIRSPGRISQPVHIKTILSARVEQGNNGNKGDKGNTGNKGNTGEDFFHDNGILNPD